MESRRFCVYIKDEEIYKLISKTPNRSAYIERALRFYIENKDVLPKVLEALAKNI